jgi:hypothetical protein
LSQNQNSVSWRRERFRELCLSGATREAIAAELAVSTKHVRKYAKELNLPTPPFQSETKKPMALPASSLTPRSKLWDASRIAALRVLWDVSAITCEDIANRINAEFGATFSKNSIIGKAGRLNLPSRTGLGGRGGNRGGSRKARPDGTQSGPDARRELAEAIAAKRQADEEEDRRATVQSLAKARAEAITAAVSPAPVAPIKTAKVAPAIIEPSASPLDGIGIFDLCSATREKAGTCRWPLDGDKTTITTKFCGADTVFGKVYCCEHRRIAYPNAKFRPGATARFIKPGAADRVFGTCTG